MRRATSLQPDSGYNLASITPPLSPEFSEGPEVVRVPGVRGSWILYYDCFEAKHYGLATSDDDMSSWVVQQDCSSGSAWHGYHTGVSFPPGVRHGSFFEVTAAELRALVEAYPTQLR